MSQRISAQRPEKIDRNHEIWVKRAQGTTVAELAVGYGLTEKRIYDVLKQVSASIPEGDRDEVVKLTVELYDRIRRDLVGIVESPPPAFAPNGKELVGRDGESIPDRKVQVSAIETLLKALGQYQKLLGLDQQPSIEDEQAARVRETANWIRAARRDSA